MFRSESGVTCLTDTHQTDIRFISIIIHHGSASNLGEHIHQQTITEGVMHNPTFTRDLLPKQDLRSEWQEEDRDIIEELDALHIEMQELTGIVIYGGTP